MASVQKSDKDLKDETAEIGEDEEVDGVEEGENKDPAKKKKKKKKKKKTGYKSYSFLFS